MDTYRPLPFVVTVDDADDPADVIDALLLGSFVAGRQPASRSARLERVRPDAPLVPAGITPSRVAAGDGRRTLLAEGPGWTLRSERWSNGCANVTVVAETDEMAAAILADVVDGASEPVPEDKPTVPIAFWHRSCNGHALRSSRAIAEVHWSAIRTNYPAAAAGALDRVMAVTPAAAVGRLLLLHGPPGTGKTTALRAIATGWRKWCDTEVVVDSERLYGDAGYLIAVLLGHGGDDDDESGRWRLLILEDCDELIRADAKKEAGQALGRLLNVTDGLIGQGLRLLVAITTNEPLGVLHPAIVRSGRCLAEIHIDRLTRAEATSWLGSSQGVPADGVTLAELYELRGTLNPVRTPERRSVAGMYL